MCCDQICDTQLSMASCNLQTLLFQAWTLPPSQVHCNSPFVKTCPAHSLVPYVLCVQTSGRARVCLLIWSGRASSGPSTAVSTPLARLATQGRRYMALQTHPAGPALATASLPHCPPGARCDCCCRVQPANSAASLIDSGARGFQICGVLYT
jgi:hypothetical protein